MSKFIKNHPLYTVRIILSIVFFAVFILERCVTKFSEWMNMYPASFMRKFLAQVSSVFPFSLFELIIFCAAVYSVFLLAVFLTAGIKKIKKKKFNFPAGKCAVVFVFVLCSVFDLFTLTLLPAYNTSSVQEKMELCDEKISERDVINAAEKLISDMKRDSELIKKREDGTSQNEMTFYETAEEIGKACEKFAEKYPFYSKGTGTAKPLTFSRPLTYTFITGIYGFFTGESNININFPEMILAPTIAHEFSHARGVSAENECNFLAFAVCTSSSDPYIRYTGEAFMIDDLLKSVKKTNPEEYKALCRLLPEVYIKDEIAYSEYMEKYSTPVATVADSVNSAYLKSLGQKYGTKSYSNTVELTVSYILKLK